MTTLTVSLDLDDAWAYMRARGIPGWTSARTILPQAAERFIRLLADARIEQNGSGTCRATVFVVGSDLLTGQGKDAVAAFQAEGCEIADHSYDHRGELASLPYADIQDDLARSQEQIGLVTNERPIGFRCPSFGASRQLTLALRTLGYRYDASPLPTPLMPLLRLYHRVTAGNVDHPPSYGSWRTALGPQRPTLASGLASVPTTTMPLIRLPIHGSYLIALAARSPGLADRYLAIADQLCRWFDLPVSFLLHPTDLLDAGDAPHLGFFPGMAMQWEDKFDFLRAQLARLRAARAVAAIKGIV